MSWGWSMIGLMADWLGFTDTPLRCDERASGRGLGVPLEAVSRWFDLQGALVLINDPDGAQ